MKSSCLRSLVGFDLQCVLVLPCDAQTARNAHDAARPVCFALFNCGFVFCRIPRVAKFAPFGIQRNAGEITACRSYHSPSPILGDDGYPIAREIYRRACASSRGRLLAAALRVGGNTKTQRHKDTEKTRNKKSLVASSEFHFFAPRLLYTASRNASLGPPYSGS